MNLLNRQVNIEDLKNKKILINLFMIHDMNEVFDVTEKSNNISILAIIKQNIIQTNAVDFVQLTAIKNYFGEKVGFMYAFVNFYTMWLINPAILGLMVTFRQYQIGSLITLWSFVYALVISIWITVFIEFWKRQENELRQRWGTLVNTKAHTNEIRKEFEGNEEFSHDNFNVNRQDKKKLGNWFLVLNYLIMLVFISACIFSFFITKKYNEDLGVYGGFLNGLIISSVNFLYQRVTEPMVRLENHKY
jgi:hypothetical protein